MSSRRLTRKEFLRAGVVAGAGVLVVACGGAPATPTAAPKAEPTKPAAAATAAPAATTAAQPAAAATKPAAAATAVPTTAAQTTTTAAAAKQTFAKVVTTKPAKFNEAPMLADLVKAGKIPSLDKRLPEDPMVVQPIEIGTYGGTVRFGDTLGGRFRSGDADYQAGGASQNALRMTPDLTGWEPNVVKDVKTTDNFKSITLSLRKGMKWSDGTPFTSRDFRFWYEDLLQSKEVTPSIQLFYRPGGKLMELETPDDYTIVLKFAIPYPVFVSTNLCHTSKWTVSKHFHPFNYLKQYYPKYNPSAADDAKANKYESWQARFLDLCDHTKNKDLPTLAPYVVSAGTATATGYKMERNPYFYGVDTAGNQLPYIDYQEVEYIQNGEMYHAKIVTGAYDFAGQSTTVLNYNAYESGAKAGNYKVLLYSSGKGAEVFFNCNLTIGDPVLKAIHQDVRYRQALSLAINREEINNLIFLGKGIPRQCTVLRSSKYFKPEYETASAKYDVAAANKLLDDMGLKWDAAKKYRLRSDGKPMQIQFDYYDLEGPKTPIIELIAEYWRKIGIDIQVKVVTRQLLLPRVTANEEAMGMWHADSCTDILLPQDPKWVAAKFDDNNDVAPPWANWYDSQGAKGEKPADWFLPVFDAYTKFRETLSPEVAAQLLKLQADNLWSIGTVGEGPLPIIVRSNLANVPEKGMDVWDGNFMYPFHTETFFIKK